MKHDKMSGAQRQPYKYHPLDTSKNEIRLIVVENRELLQLLTDIINEDPEVSSDLERVRYLEEEYPVHCLIQPVSLDSKLAWAALSYTRGDASKTRRLIVEEDGEEFELQITENLDSALRNIDIESAFWVDAVCINQADEMEKSWQVQQMWMIYNSADYMATWLGAAADDSDLLMDQFSNLEVIQRQRNEKTLHEYLEMLKDWKPPEDFISLHAFSNLTKRPYWCRVWIQQELHASKNVWLHCGRKKVHMSLVLLGLKQLNKMHEDKRQLGLVLVRRDSYAAYLGTIIKDDDMCIASRAILLYRTNPQKMPKSLPMLLKSVYVYGEGLKASDPRDFIYGLLNISDDPASLGIIADYSKSKRKLFVDVAIALSKEIGLQILLWRNTHSLLKTDQPLPSWAPDWSERILIPLADPPKASNFRFQASRDSQSEFSFSNYSNGPINLTVTGIVVDSVLAVGDSVMEIRISDRTIFDHDQDQNFNLALRWLRDVENLSKHCGNMYGGVSGTKEAIWRTPIADTELTLAGKHQRAAKSLEECHQYCKSGIMRAVLKGHELQQKRFALAGRYWRLLVTRCSNRKLFVTEKGYLGLGPAAVLTGDIIAVILGLDTPLVLRRSGVDGYQIVGEAYVHGIMDGETMKGSPSTERFNIC
jgi:hypothetical protein